MTRSDYFIIAFILLWFSIVICFVNVDCTVERERIEHLEERNARLERANARLQKEVEQGVGIFNEAMEMMGGEYGKYGNRDNAN